MNRRGRDYIRQKLYDQAVEQFQGIIMELGDRRLPDTDYVSDARRYIEKCKALKQAEVSIVKSIVASVKDAVSRYRGRENETMDISINIKLDTPRHIWKDVAAREIYRIVDKYGLPFKRDDTWPHIYYTNVSDIESFEKDMPDDFL